MKFKEINDKFNELGKYSNAKSYNISSRELMQIREIVMEMDETSLRQARQIQELDKQNRLLQLKLRQYKKRIEQLNIKNTDLINALDLYERISALDTAEEALVKKLHKFEKVAQQKNK